MNIEGSVVEIEYHRSTTMQTTTTHRYIAYLRVSTDRQGKSGLGLEAQQAAIVDFARSNNGHVIDSVVEVESGKNNDRPQLAKAMKLCRVYNATLLVAKLDRLSRNVHFLTGLMEARVRFRCCDMPDANETILQFMAVIAEHERKAISARTKAALSAAKARGKKLGRYKGKAGNWYIPAAKDRKRAASVMDDTANKFARDLVDIFEHLEEQGFVSGCAKAEELNRMNVPTFRGGKWTSKQVIRYLDRINPRC